MKKTLLIIFTLFIVTNKISAQEPEKLDSIHVFSVEQAQAYALENNVEIINKELDIEKARWQIWETTAIGLPQINGSAEYQQFPDIPTTLMPNFMTPMVVGVNTQLFGLTPIAPISEDAEMIEMQMGSEYNLKWGVTATQLIFSGEYIVGLQATRIFKELSKQSFEKSVIDLKSTIAQSYYLVLISEQSRQILDSSYANIQTILYETQKMAETGLLDPIQADQIKLTELTIKNQLTALKRQEILVRRLLKFQMGIDLNDSIVLTDNLEQILATTDLSSLLMQEFSFYNNIDYQMLQTQEVIMKLDVKRSQSSCLPTLSAFYSYSKNAMRDEFNFADPDEPWFPTSLIGLNLTVPIWSSGQRYAQVQQKQIEVHKVQNMKSQLEQGLIIQFEEAKNNYISAYETYLNEKQNMELSKRIYNNTLIQYKQGTMSSLELTQAQNQYLNTQGAYFQSMINLLNAKTNLEKIIN